MLSDVIMWKMFVKFFCDFFFFFYDIELFASSFLSKLKHHLLLFINNLREFYVIVLF